MGEFSGLPRLRPRIYMDHLCYFCLVLLSFHARLFVDALWSPAGKGLTSWISFVMSNSQFHAEFSRHVPICSETSRIENNLANHQSSQRRDLYFNKHCKVKTCEFMQLSVILGSSITRLAR